MGYHGVPHYRGDGVPASWAFSGGGRPLDEYQKRSVDISWRRGDLERLQDHLTSAAADGDQDEIERLTRRVSKARQDIGRLERLQATEGNMTRHDANYKKAVTALADGVLAAATDIQKLNAERGKYPARWYETEKARLIAVARGHDDLARAKLSAYAEEASEEAVTFRTQADADKDPADRVADAMELQRLASSDVSAENLLQQARNLLKAGRPARAEMFLDAAEPKISSVTGDRRLDLNIEAHAVGVAVRDALDEAVPARSAARQIEESVARNTADYETSRLRILAASGLGTTESGMVGTGALGQAASANAAAKALKFMEAQRRGEPYKSDPEDGAVAVAAATEVVTS